MAFRGAAGLGVEGDQVVKAGVAPHRRLFDAGLANLIAENGSIILSGILFEQEQSVLEAAQAHGLGLIERRQLGDWVALALSR